MSFNFNKLGDMFLQLGQKTLQTGVFYASTKALNSPCNINQSVFGCGSFGGFGGYSYGGVFGFGMQGMGCGMGGDIYSQLGMIDPYYAQMSIAQGAAHGQALGEYLKSQPSLFQGASMLRDIQTQQTLKPTGNKAAEKYKDHPTEQGELFEQQIKEKKDASFVSSEWKEKAEGEEKDEEYKTYASNFAKSYLAHMDETAGNKDNEITLEEFTKYSDMVDLDEDSTDEQRADLKRMNIAAFKHMDQNGDGKIDWKEMASVLGTFDSVIDGKHDGTITHKELTKAFDTATIAQRYRDEYTRLFGNDNKEDK